MVKGDYMINIESSVLVAIIGLAITVVGQAVYVAYQLGKLEQKLDTLEKKQDKHNGVIERTYNIEKIVERHGEKIKVANERIKDLEHSIFNIER